ncbi:hypothetical protein [Burkholderia cepacia]|uniref:hypothetical protein n=1 Tax=Burkholderia cepacia TaxID=292 RepID=UPI002AB7B1BC|nr:hypothetical protein [Burkholderia cepacia]
MTNETAKTTIDLRGTYRWPIDANPAEPIRWSGIDLSDVLDVPLPGFCAYYGHGMSDAIGADYLLTKKKVAFGRVELTQNIATIEMEAQVPNPVPGSTSSIERWAQIDLPPVLDLRPSRYPAALRPVIVDLFGTTKFRDVLRAAPYRAREICDAIPHLKAIVFSVACNDDVARTIMWIIDPVETITSITSKSGLTFEVKAPPAPKVPLKGPTPARKSRRATR